MEEAVSDLQGAIGDGDDAAACKLLTQSLRGVFEDNHGNDVKLLLRGDTSPDKFSGFEIADASVVEPGSFAGVTFDGTDIEVGLRYSSGEWQTDVIGSGAATIDEGE